MTNTYSIAFCPPPEIVELVRQDKQFLVSRIGRYSSVNSWAHITIAGFIANRSQLAKLSQYAEEFCAKRPPFMVRFDHYDTYASGAFYLAPDERSHRILAPIMKDFGRKMPLPASRFTDPHMSIARGLDMHRLPETRRLFSTKTPDMSFILDGISLRRLNEARGQYDIIAHFPFISSSNSSIQAYDCAWQGHLF